MIRSSQLASILDGYSEYFPEEHTMVEALRRGLDDAQGEPSDRAVLPGHFTASALVVNQSCTKVLLVHHALLQKWIEPGGHLEPHEQSVMMCAQREAEEETAITGLERLFPHMGEVPFFIDSHPIPENLRKQEPPHRHYDLRYAFYADESVPLSHEVGAIHAVEWVPIDAMETIKTDESVIASLRKLAELLRNGVASANKQSF